MLNNHYLFQNVDTLVCSLPPSLLKLLDFLTKGLYIALFFYTKIRVLK
jgi:hypothetical protein